MCAPSVRMFFESKICPLEPLATSDLKVTLCIPKDSKHHYYTLLFKIKSPEKSYVGPNMIAFIKIIDSAGERDAKEQLKNQILALSSIDISS